MTQTPQTEKAWNPLFIFWWSACFSCFAGSILLADQFERLGFPEKKRKCTFVSSVLGILFLTAALLGINYFLLAGANLLFSFFLIIWQMRPFSEFQKRNGEVSYWPKPALLTLGAGILFMIFLISVQETRQALRYRPYEAQLAKAQQAREDGDLQTSERILMELETKNPDEPAAYIELSYVYEDMGILDSAQKQAQLAWEKTHKAFSKGNLFLNRLRLLRWKDNLKQRMEDLPMAIHGQDAIRDWSMGDRESALRKLRNLQKKYPSAYQSQAALALLYKTSGEFELAITEAQAAIQKIDAQLALRKMSPQAKKLVERDRKELQSMIDALRDFYAEN